MDSIRDAQATGIQHLATKADVAELKADVTELKGRIVALEGRVNTLQWVVGIQSALMLAIALRVFGLV